ncbi:MAG: hypothetical protein WCG26_04175, partial [Chloroflexales bacterium]
MIIQLPTVGDSVAVLFRLPTSIWADNVHLVGDFNGWSITATPMRRSEQFWEVTLLLTANNTYTGNTIINGNILQIGNNGITGTLGTGNVTNSGGLLFSRSDAAYIYGGVINGTGGVTNTGTGTMTWIGNNLYTGPTAITAGKLHLGPWEHIFY